MPRIIRHGHGKAIMSKEFDSLCHEDRNTIVQQVRVTGRTNSDSLKPITLRNGRSVTVRTRKSVGTG